MNEDDKNRVNILLDECLDSLLQWEQRSSSIHALVSQIHSLKRSKWSYYDLSETVKKAMHEELEMRLMDEVELIFNEIERLDTRQKALHPYKSSLHVYCSSQISDVKNPDAFEYLSLLRYLDVSLSILVGTLMVPQGRMSLQNLDSFEILREADEVVGRLKKDFVHLVEKWKKSVSAH